MSDEKKGPGLDDVKVGEWIVDAAGDVVQRTADGWAFLYRDEDESSMETIQESTIELPIVRLPSPDSLGDLWSRAMAALPNFRDEAGNRGEFIRLDAWAGGNVSASVSDGDRVTFMRCRGSLRDVLSQVASAGEADQQPSRQRDARIARLTRERDEALTILRRIANVVDLGDGDTIQALGAAIEAKIEGLRSAADAYESNAKTLDDLSRKIWDAAKALGVDGAGVPHDVIDRIARLQSSMVAPSEAAQMICSTLGFGWTHGWKAETIASRLSRAVDRVEDMVKARGVLMDALRGVIDRDVFASMSPADLSTSWLAERIATEWREAHEVAKSAADSESIHQAMITVATLAADETAKRIEASLAERLDVRESQQAERDEIQAALVRLADRVGGPALVYDDPLSAQIDQLAESAAGALGRYAAICEAFRTWSGVLKQPDEPIDAANARALEAIRLATMGRTDAVAGLRQINEAVEGCPDTRADDDIDALILGTLVEAKKGALAFSIINSLIDAFGGDDSDLLNIDDPRCYDRLHDWLTEMMRTGGMDATIQAMRDHADALVEESDDWPDDDAERETREVMARGIRQACEDVEQAPIEELVANLAAAHAVEPAEARAAADACLEAFGDDPDTARAEVAVEHQRAAFSLEGDHPIVRAVEIFRHLPDRLQDSSGDIYARDPRIAVDTGAPSASVGWRLHRRTVRVVVWRHAHVWYASGAGNRVCLGHDIEPEMDARAIMEALTAGHLQEAPR